MRKKFMGVVAIGAAVLLMAATAAAAATVTVNETNLGADWTANIVGSGSGLAFVTEHGAPPGLGTGALQFVTENANTARAEVAKTVDVPLSDVGALSYWTYQTDHAGNPGLAAVAYKLSITCDGGGWTTLVYEPYWQNGTGDAAPVVGQTWQQWTNIENGNWWSSRTACGLTAGYGGPPFYTLAEADSSASNVRVASIQLGIGTYNPDWVVLADGMTFAGTTYDFEPVPLTKDSCKDGGWTNSALHGQEFVNQGDCVSFYASGGKTRGPKS